MNKTPSRIRTRNLRFTNPIPQPLSYTYDYTQPNRLITQFIKTFKSLSCDDFKSKS